jgi:hypothetical protein
LKQQPNKSKQNMGSKNSASRRSKKQNKKINYDSSDCSTNDTTSHNKTTLNNKKGDDFPLTVNNFENTSTNDADTEKDLEQLHRNIEDDDLNNDITKLKLSENSSTNLINSDNNDITDDNEDDDGFNNSITFDMPILECTSIIESTMSDYDNEDDDDITKYHHRPFDSDLFNDNNDNNHDDLNDLKLKTFEQSPNNEDDNRLKMKRKNEENDNQMKIQLLHLNQNIKRIRRNLDQLPFRDQLFPSGSISLSKNRKSGFYKKLPKNIVWLRIADIVKIQETIEKNKAQPQFLIDKDGYPCNNDLDDLYKTEKYFSIFDISQGYIGDCFHIAAIMGITRNKSLLPIIIPSDNAIQSNMKKGAYHFRFWKLGFWYDVVVDDYLPTLDGQVYFAHNKVNKNEFWAALFEKAFAKLVFYFNS